MYFKKAGKRYYILVFVIISLVGIFIFNYFRINYLLTLNPIIYEFSSNDINTFQQEFNIIFVENTEIIEAQFFYDFREPSCQLIFKFQKNRLNEFIINISTNYYEDIYSKGKENYNDKLDKGFNHKKNEYTSIYLYNTNEGYVKAILEFYRPSKKIKNIFKNKL